jgi:hypothetical protein
VFDRALLYCERGKDGTCLGVFTARETGAVDLQGLARIIEGFHSVEQ